MNVAPSAFALALEDERNEHNDFASYKNHEVLYYEAKPIPGDFNDPRVQEALRKSREREEAAKPAPVQQPIQRPTFTELRDGLHMLYEGDLNGVLLDENGNDVRLFRSLQSKLELSPGPAPVALAIIPRKLILVRGPAPRIEMIHSTDTVGSFPPGALHFADGGEFMYLFRAPQYTSIFKTEAETFNIDLTKYAIIGYGETDSERITVPFRGEDWRNAPGRFSQVTDAPEWILQPLRVAAYHRSTQ